MNPVTTEYPSLTKELTLTATLAATFVVSTFLPVSAFIGGAALITSEILIVPVIAAVLRPVWAGIAATAGSLGMAFFQTGIFPVFGPLGLLIPVLATILGSIGFHYRWGPVASWGYVLAGATYYIVYSGGTPLWLAPYLLVLISLPLVLRMEGTHVTGFLTLYTTMSEQVTMNILSIALLGFVGGIWAIITPFMLLERAIATLGGLFLIVALKNRFGTKLQLGRTTRR